MITFEAPTMQDLQYIADNLREKDRIELEATHEKAAPVVMSCLGVIGAKHVVKVDGEPVFVGGFVPSALNTVFAWGFGTDKASKYMKTITRFIRMCLKAIKTTGVTRVETKCALGVAPIAWLCAIGLNQTSNIGKYNGQTFVMQFGEI